MKNKRLYQLAGKGIKMLLIDCFSAFMISTAVVVFAANADFAPGGINGMAMIVNYLTGFPIGRAALLLNIPIVLISFRLLGTRFLLTSLKTMVISTLFIDYVACHLPPFEGSRLVAALCAGACAGTGYACIYLQNSSTGGSDFLIMSAKKLRPQMSIGQLTQILDGSVILAAAFVLKRVDAVFLGLLYTAVNSVMIDFVMRFLREGRLPLPVRHFFVPEI